MHHDVIDQHGACHRRQALREGGLAPQNGNSARGQHLPLRNQTRDRSATPLVNLASRHRVTIGRHSRVAPLIEQPTRVAELVKATRDKICEDSDMMRNDVLHRPGRASRHSLRESLARDWLNQPAHPFLYLGVRRAHIDHAANLVTR
jgi:hypothetical protein